MGYPHDPLLGSWHDLGVDEQAAHRHMCREMARLLVHTCRNDLISRTPASPLATRVLTGDVRPVYASVNTSSVAGAFFSAAQTRGVTLYEPFGGLWGRSGDVHAHRHTRGAVPACTVTPTWQLARRQAHHSVSDLHMAHPHLLPPSALADTFTALPQDVTQIDRDVLLAAGAYNTATSAQWLVIAGWECQDLSPAGDGAGLAGPRSSTFTDLTRIIVLLQLVQPSRPPAYIVENAAMQHNFNHPRVREHDFQQVCSVLGPPVCVDAARFGARAHRLRNFWSNLADPSHLTHVLSRLRRPIRSVQDAGFLDSGRSTAVAQQAEQAPFVVCNQPGHPVCCWPTLVAYTMSYSFQPGKPGAVYDAHGVTSEPSVRERELALGYVAGTTAAPGVTLVQRHAITGRCMDANCMEGLITFMWALHDERITPYGMIPAVSATLALGGETSTGPTSAFACCQRAGDGDYMLAATALAVVATAAEELPKSPALQDIWNDTSCLQRIQSGIIATELEQLEVRRVNRRAKSYKWALGKLYRIMPDSSKRVCPAPQDRADLVKATHEQLGHFGVRRTAALLRLNFW